MVAVMDHGTGDGGERFGDYSEALAEVIGHADRERPLRDYCLGHLMPGERKSVLCGGVQSTLSVWPPGREPLPPKPWTSRGRPPSLIGRDPDHRPVSAKAMAASLAEDPWRIVT